MKQRKRMKRQSLRALTHYYYKVAKWNGTTGLGWKLSEYFAGKNMETVVGSNVRFVTWDVEHGEWSPS